MTSHPFGPGRLLMCVAILCWAGVLPAQRGAADPIIGSWTLNLTQSKIPAGVPGAGMLKSQTEVYREVRPGQLEMVLSRVQNSGETEKFTLVWPIAGGAVQLLEGTRPPGETLVETRLGPGDWLVTYMINGEQYGTMRKIISGDGKSMRQTFTGMIDGKPLELVFVVERQ